MENLSDIELYGLMSTDEKTARKAFAELYIRYSTRLYAYCRRFLGNKEEAEDAYQEIFVKFFESRKQQRLMTNISAFIMRIAHNVCINLKRNERKIVSFDDYMSIQDDNRPEKDDLLNLIKSALELLQPEYREVFILREYDGMSYQEIGEVLNMNVSTVKIRIYRAKEKVREILQPYLAELSKLE